MQVEINNSSFPGNNVHIDPINGVPPNLRSHVWVEDRMVPVTDRDHTFDIILRNDSGAIIDRKNVMVERPTVQLFNDLYNLDVTTPMPLDVGYNFGPIGFEIDLSLWIDYSNGVSINPNVFDNESDYQLEITCDQAEIFQRNGRFIYIQNYPTEPNVSNPSVEFVDIQLTFNISWFNPWRNERTSDSFTIMMRRPPV